MTNSTDYGISGTLTERIKNALELNLKTQIKKIVPNLHPADQADLIGCLNKNERIELIKILGSQLDPEVLLELEGDLRNDIILYLEREDLINILSKLDVDDVVYILEDIEDNDFIKGIMEERKLISKKELIEESLSYPEDSIGRLMGPTEYTAVPKDWTVEEVIKYMQKNRSLTGEFSEIVVVDEYYRPVSTVSAGQILKSESHKKISRIMRDVEDLKILRCDMNQEEASLLFKKYDLSSAPVVNDNGVLIGMIYLPDIIDVIEEESKEDLLLMGNVSEDDTHSGVLRSAKNRFPWLVITILATSISSAVISCFSGTVEKLVVLSALMPLASGIGGIAGTQTLTVMVRNLAGRKFNNMNIGKVICKETFTGLLNGIGIGVIGGIGVYIWKHNFMLAFIFFLTLVFVLVLGGFIASIVPLILNKLKFDPAVSSGSFITTTIDSLTFLLILQLATVLLL